MKKKGKISENNFNLFIVAFTRFNNMNHVQENTLITSICTVHLIIIIVLIHNLDLKIQLKELQRFSGV